MANLIYNYNTNDTQIISPEGISATNFAENDVFMRVIIYNSNGNIISLTNNRQTIFYSSYNNDNSIIVHPSGNINNDSIILKSGMPGDFTIYKNDNSDHIYIKPNEILANYGLSQGDYSIRIDIVRQIQPSAQLGIPTYFEEFDINNDDQLTTADELEWESVGRPDIADMVRKMVVGDDEMPPKHFQSGQADTQPSQGQQGQPGMGTGGGPVDEETIATEEGTIGEFEYRLPSEFFNDKFIIKEISPTRTECRIKFLDSTITNDSNFINHFKAKMGTPYAYQYHLQLGNGVSTPIINYTFDNISNGHDNQSIIIKTYDPIPSTVGLISAVTFEQQLITSQQEDLFYFSDVAESTVGNPLLIDQQQNWINSQGEENEFENYNQLTSSFSSFKLQTFISGSLYDYPNLNVDYDKFENHTFFGSAKRKLENFNNKVSTIQGYYNEISKSLKLSCSIDNDFTSIRSYRTKLFEKIQSEIDNLTPYERWLYTDAQSISTASAPSIANYIDTYAINTNVDFRSNELNQTSFADSKNSLPGVYTVTQSVDNVTPTYIFKDKYRVENKPFFNYSSSLYLSFLVKGHENWTENTGSDNNPHVFNHNNTLEQHNGIITPEDSMHNNFIQSASLTASEYRRFVIEASSSYWAPTAVANYDAGSVDYFAAGSTQIEILHNSVKTGSHTIIASGPYQSLATVVTQSGIPFSGSIMPSGDLFNVYWDSSISNISGSWNVDNQTSGSAVTNEMLNDHSGRGNSGSIEGTPTIADGLTFRGKTYGKSIQFISESSEGIRFYTDTDLNFTRDDNFSLSVWAKRFHPKTGSADPTGISTGQSIFTRGHTTVSYGIDYVIASNKLRAGVRGAEDDGHYATHIVTDDLLEWNHIVFTFESGSTEGIKLYLNGEMVESKPTTGATYTVTGSNHFSASAANIGSTSDALNIGGNDVLGGNSGYYNGYIQYPRIYDKTITQDEVQKLYLNPDGILKADITDVKLTTDNPNQTKPFDTLFHTSSAEWTGWYDGLYDSASYFDEQNIHSLENNLPLFIQQDTDYNELKSFIAIQGEQFDLIRNHIDGLGTFYNRSYNKLDSVPTNITPILLDNLGWNAIQPFSSSLADFYGQSLSSITSQKDIAENTWRKTLNNLMYLYKTKGTENSVRALLNIYGYPPDILRIKEFAQSEQFQYPNPGESEILNDDFNFGSPPPISDDNKPSPGINWNDTDLGRAKGNISFNLSKKKLYHYRMDRKSERVLNLDWYYNSVTASTVEFVYKHTETTNTQELLRSAGSGSENLWDLILVPSSDGLSSSLQFRLNNSQYGDSNISSRAYSMSLDYTPMKHGELWNIMIQNMTSSIVGQGTNEYRLYSAIQDKSRIDRLLVTTMSISGGAAGGGTPGGLGFYANQNWGGTGSRAEGSSSNLQVGKTMSGSIAEFRTWSTVLSASKFRIHTLNKLSTVGNQLDSHHNELIYHYKLNENHISASVSGSSQTTLTIQDAGPQCIQRSPLFKNYNFTVSSSLATASLTYGYDFVDVNTLSLIGTGNTQNKGKVNIITRKKLIKNLNPSSPASIDDRDQKRHKANRVNSNKIDINSSPQDFVDDFILDKTQGHNLQRKFADPRNIYSQSYSELDSFRQEFFKCFPIKVDTNKYIKAHEKIFETSLIDDVKFVLPAKANTGRGKLSGVTIRQNILEKQRYVHKRPSHETNPNTGEDEIKIINRDTYQSGFSTNNSILDTTKNSEISQNENIKLSDSILSEAKTSTTAVNEVLSKEASIETTKNSEISPLPSAEGSKLDITIDGTNSYVSTHYTKEFRNLHSEWGTSSADTHFINYFGTSSYNDYNTNHIEPRYHFYTFGDIETYSGSIDNATDFSNSKRFFNRQNISEFVHKNITYNSYMNGNPGVQIGRALGKTRYFITSSETVAASGSYPAYTKDTIILPSNHYRNFSDPFVDTMWNGAQNTNPGILPLKNQEDYSTSSFYRVKVTGGENQIIIRTPGGPADDIVIEEQPPPPPL